MGGYMTYRLGLLMPDRFARASAYVGPPAYGLWPYPLPVQNDDPTWTTRGITTPLIPNALDLPFEMVSGHADELVPYASVQHQADSFKAAGNAYALHEHAGDDHFSFILADQWRHTKAFLGDAQIDRNPPRVRYVRMPSQDLPKFGLTFDHAYWVSSIVVRDAKAEDALGTVDATTFGRGGTEMTPVASTLPDPAPVGATPAVIQQQVLTPGKAIPQSNGFRVTLTNVSGARFGLKRMGLDPRRALSVAVVSDGEAKLRLRGRFPAGVSVKGYTFRRARRELRVIVPAGEHTVQITP
jgi:hypothetical protein